jgi:hypothetical protein
MIKKILIGLLDVFINGPFVNFYKITRYPLISDTAIEIAKSQRSPKKWNINNKFKRI